MLQLRSLPALVLAAAAVASAAPVPRPLTFTVKGKVYCDNCRAGFETSASPGIPGAMVKMECRHFITGEVKHSAEAATDAMGWYKMEVGDDHQEEICDVALVRSPDPECAEVERSRASECVPLTRNNGIKQHGVRKANSIAFFRKEPLKECGEILRKYQLYDDTSENP